MSYSKEMFSMHILQQKHMNSVGADSLLERAVDLDQKSTKNVCAKLSADLSDHIDNISKALGMSKRMFIEIAIINAIQEVELISQEYGCELTTNGAVLVTPDMKGDS